MNLAGIGVSAKTVTLLISRDERAGKPRKLKNASQGHVTLSNRLRKANVSHVCLEATGLYHLDLALALDDAGLDLRIAALNELRTQTKNQLHAAEQTATTLDFLIADLQQSITQIDAQIAHLR